MAQVQASFPISPPILNLPMGRTVDGKPVYWSPQGIQFIQQMYAAIQGSGGVAPGVQAIQDADIVLGAPAPGLPNARVLEGTTPGLAIDLTVANIAHLVLDVIAAIGFTPAPNNAPFITSASSGALSDERVLDSDPGITIDVSTVGIIKLISDVVTALGYTPADVAGDTFSGPVDVTAQLSCDSFKISDVATPSVATVTDSIPIETTSGTRYILLSAVP